MKNQFQVTCFRSHVLISCFFIFLLWLATCYLRPAACFAQEETPDLSYYEIIEQRNFFRPTKDLQETKIKTDNYSAFSFSSNSTSIQNLVLTGVINIKNGYKAIVEKTDQDKGYYVAVGDMIEDYVVKDILNNKIFLERDSQIFDLKLREVRINNVSSGQSENKPLDQTTINTQDNNQTNHQINPMQQLRTGGRGQR
ncbi:MAG: hypothetical protein ABII88_01250 [Candidatus Omnitrophota bacterium]